MAVWAVAVIILSVVGCENGSTSLDAAETLQVRGRVLEVVGRDILEVETLRIRDSSNNEWTFITEGFVGFSPSHIRQHQLQGELVVITYVKRGEVLVAVDVSD